MITQIIRVDTKKNEPEKIHAVAEILSRDGVVVYPTDTFYGLGVNCFSISAIQKAYVLKRRERSKPLSVVVSDTVMLRTIAIGIPPILRSLEADFWPGPLTLILQAGPLIPDDLLGPKRTIGIRIPAHSWVRRLIRAAGFPITATSANISGEKEVSSAEQAIRIFKGRVEGIVDGGQAPGPTASTVLDLTTEKPTLIREGAIPLARLKKFVT